jgi:hypothetical protein
MRTSRDRRTDAVVVCLPDVPDLAHMGAFAPNVDVRLVPPGSRAVPDLADVDIVVPLMRARGPVLELLCRATRAVCV